MIPTRLEDFREVWLVDFEFRQPDGERPTVVCLAARDLFSCRRQRLWWDILRHFEKPPFPIDEGALYVAYYASAEMLCHLSQGWQMPVYVLDLFTEFRNLTNGRAVPGGKGLIGALRYHGLDAIDTEEKTELRELAMREGTHSGSERVRLLDYCQSDVDALAKLLPAMLPKIDLPRALLRGRYMKAAAAMEFNGVPIDVDTLTQLRDNWEGIKTDLIREIDADFDCFVPTNQRKLTTDSAFGAAILGAAADADLDPHQLADVADYVWRQEREAAKQIEAAKTVARKRSGLNAAVIDRAENRLLDHTSFPGLDVVARSLAGELPELGIGPGYETEAGYDDHDYPAELWRVLSEPKQQPKPRHDPAIVDEAVGLLLQNPAEQYCGPLSFSAERFAQYLAANDIPWPRTESGQLSLRDDTFRDAVKRHPELAPLKELRVSLGQLRLNSLSVGQDGRNRCMLSAFRSTTGRNQPSNARFIFGPAAWIRSLIQPEPGRAIAYVDWSQQEFGIAAALSGDENMKTAYQSGDPYLTFAKQAGAVPENATKRSHPDERSRFKVCALAVQYGMGPQSLAAAIGEPEINGRELLRLHQSTYPTFWKWSQAAVDRGELLGYLQTVFGWRVIVGEESNPRSLANFPCQANGAEMLRLACCLLTEAGIRVCAPVHDAVLVEGPADEIDGIVIETQQLMRQASEVILSGFAINTDAEIVRHPDRYRDERGTEMWETINRLLDACTVAYPATWDEF